MKILYFITKSEGGGGAQTHVMQLARFMIEQGHEVAIMSQPGGWLESRASELGVTYLENSHIDNTLNPLTLWRAGKSLSESIDQFKPDVVSCHSTIAGIVGRLTVRGHMPTIFTAHGWGFAPGIPEPRRSLVQKAEWLAARWATSIICVSDYDRNLALNVGVGNPSQVLTIHNGVEPITLTDREPHNRVEALFVGRLVHQKDPLTLINAIAELDDTTRNKLHLTIIGDGPLEKPSRALITKHQLGNTISISPRLDRIDLFKKYSSSDLFLLISNWEGFPRSILEAMAHGLPVIASDVGGTAEAVDDNTGMLVPRGNQSAITQALKRMINEPALRTQMGLAGRAKVQNEFSLEAMCQKTEVVYRSITPSTGSGNI